MFFEFSLNLELHQKVLESICIQSSKNSLFSTIFFSPLVSFHMYIFLSLSLSPFGIYLFDFSVPGRDDELEWSFEQIEFIKDISLGLDFKLHV